MKLRIFIDMDNDAFQPDPGPEVAVILRSLRGRLMDEDCMWKLHPDLYGEAQHLRDTNGNTVGWFQVLEDEV